ncbi:MULTISPECIES: hypothetical protein [Nostoc]|nr:MULTISPECIES: hypothetical protein [Nostoc]
MPQHSFCFAVPHRQTVQVHGEQVHGEQVHGEQLHGEQLQPID